MYVKYFDCTAYRDIESDINGQPTLGPITDAESPEETIYMCADCDEELGYSWREFLDSTSDNTDHFGGGLNEEGNSTINVEYSDQT